MQSMSLPSTAFRKIYGWRSWAKYGTKSPAADRRGAVKETDSIFLCRAHLTTMLVCRRCKASGLVLLLALAQNSVAFVITQTNFLAQRQPTSPHPLVRRSVSRVVTCVNARMNSDTTPPPDLAARSRAGFLKGLFGATAALATVGAAPKETPAIDLGPLRLPFAGAGKETPPEQAKVVEVAKYTRVVDKLVDDLQTGTLKGGDEDSAVVARVLESYLRPMQETMLEVTPAVQMQLSGQKNRERSGLLPLLMKGHLLELEQACGTKDAKDQLKEVEEVKETLDEFVSLAKTRYDIKLPKVEAAPEGDQLGIFGCNFYGMKRMDGTNICQPDP